MLRSKYIKKRHYQSRPKNKGEPIMCYLLETHFKYKDIYRLKVKRWRMVYHAALDWMFVFSPSIHMLKPNPQRDGFLRAVHFGSWLDHKGGAPMNGISDFIKGSPENSLCLLPCEDTRRELSTNQEAGRQQTSSGWHLDFWFPRVHNCEK